jgi:hypothetical protein
MEYKDLLDKIYSTIHRVSDTEGNFKRNLKKYLEDIEDHVLNQYEADKSGVPVKDYVDSKYSTLKKYPMD